MAKRIYLHGIDREIRAVAVKLRTARRTASAEERAKLDAVVSRLEALRAQTRESCPKVFAIWPPPVKPPAKPPTKPPAKPPTKPPAKKKKPAAAPRKAGRRKKRGR